MSNQNYNVNLNEMLGINDKNINIYHFSEEKIKIGMYFSPSAELDEIKEIIDGISND